MAEASRALRAVSLLHGFQVDEQHVPFGADALMRFGQPFPLSSRNALLAADAVLVAAKSDAALRHSEADLDLRASIVRVRLRGRAELTFLAPLAADALGVDARARLRARCRKSRPDHARRHRGGLGGRSGEARTRMTGWRSSGCHRKTRPPSVSRRSVRRHCLRAPCSPALAELLVPATRGRSPGAASPPARRASSVRLTEPPTDIAGQGVADPSSMLLAAALMLGEGLGEGAAAATLLAVSYVRGNRERRAATAR